MNSTTFLLESEVKEILTLYATGEWTHSRLAKKFGVHRTQIGRILSLKCWTYIGASKGMRAAIKQIASNKS